MNIAPNIRSAILANSAITSKLSTWEGEPSVHTRRPLPENASYPLVAISPDISYTDQDFLSSEMPVVVRDIFVFGQQPDHYRVVEEIAYSLRDMFHRQNQTLVSSTIHVVSLNASGPRVAPTDNEAFVGRMVTLTIRMQKK